MRTNIPLICALMTSTACFATDDGKYEEMTPTSSMKAERYSVVEPFSGKDEQYPSPFLTKSTKIPHLDLKVIERIVQHNEDAPSDDEPYRVITIEGSVTVTVEKQPSTTCVIS